MEQPWWWNRWSESGSLHGDGTDPQRSDIPRTNAFVVGQCSGRYPLGRNTLERRRVGDFPEGSFHEFTYETIEITGLPTGTKAAVSHGSCVGEE